MKRIAATSAGILALLAGCGGPTRIHVKGIKPLNENERKESTPVDIRIYQLKDDARFRQAPFENLWVKPKEALGDDVVAEKTVTVLPGAPDDRPREIDLGELPPPVRFIGVLALFPKEDEAKQRRVIVGHDEASSGVFELTGYHITWRR
jgi:type VI secretion system VasD/TssJ family lipoprotein